MQVRPLLLFVLSLIAACATPATNGVFAQNPAPLPETPSETCNAETFETTRLLERDRDMLWSESFSSVDSGQYLSMTGGQLITGPCAGLVISYRSGYGVLANGQSFTILADAPVVFGPALTPPSTPQSAAPQLENCDHVGSSEILGESISLGLWDCGTIHRLASFSSPGAPSSGGVNTLLETTLEVISVSYLPSPDSAGGIIGLVVERPGESLLLSITWLPRRGSEPRTP